MNGLTLAKIAKADALLNATHFIIAAKLPDETQITTARVTACLIRLITLAVVRGFGGDWKNRRSNLGKKRATQPKTAFSQDLQIVRVGTLGETFQRTILLFEATRRQEEVLTLLGGVLRRPYPCC
jgi:hypothetical protein